MALGETDEVVVWPSFWRAYLKCFLAWFVSLGFGLIVINVLHLLLGSGLPPPPFSPVPNDVMLLFHGMWLLTLVASFYFQACGRVCTTAEGIRPPNGQWLRGRIVYPWDQIESVELVRKWYGRWLLVTTTRKRFFYVEANVTHPTKFIEAVEYFAGTRNPLALALRHHLRGWLFVPFVGEK